MENGSFQNLNLSHLDFAQGNDDNNMERNLVPTPVGTSSFQTLLTQNEDLVARLRVTLKSLSSLEQQNKKLQENFDTVRSQSSAVFDQLLIWKEKEKIWKEKEQNLERLRRDENRENSIEIDLLRQKSGQLEKSQEELDRYKKYHEKIKTAVKPYIQKLKGYAQSLYEQTQDLNSTLIAKEVQISQLESSLFATKEEARRREEIFQLQKNELISMFEDERQSLKTEIVHLQELNEVLTEKTRHLDRSLERQDELENLVVALRRSKDDLLQSHLAEDKNLKLAYSKNQQDLKIAQMQTEDLKTELSLIQNQLKQTETTAAETLEQLTSLRYLWTQKSQENEKLKMSLSGLEKLNLELSQKLKTLRAQD